MEAVVAALTGQVGACTAVVDAAVALVDEAEQLLDGLVEIAAVARLFSFQAHQFQVAQALQAVAGTVGLGLQGDVAEIGARLEGRYTAERCNEGDE